MKICLCTWYDENIKEFADINYLINKKYADKYEYDFIKCNQRRLENKDLSWEKLSLIYSLFEKQYDYIVWIDADAFFYIDSPPIENIINEHNEESVIFSGDMQTRFQPYPISFQLMDINCGLMIYKNNNYSKKFINHWILNEYPIINPVWWEQNNALHMYKNNILDIQNNSVIIEYNILQHFKKEHLEHCFTQKYGLNNKPFIFHMAGEIKEQRIKYSKEYYNLIKDITIIQNYNLTEIMNKEGSDKGKDRHNYTKIYEELFDKIKNDVHYLCEFGLGTNNINIKCNMGINGIPGASLRGWKKYFKNAMIYGGDIDKTILINEKRINSYYINVMNNESIKNFWNNIPYKMDIIIDDSLHKFDTNCILFENSYNKFNKYYIIEDILNIYFNQWENKLKEWKLKYKEFNFKLLKMPLEHNKDDNNLIIIENKNS